jgi:homoserine dehydrogenase
LIIALALLDYTARRMKVQPVFLLGFGGVGRALLAQILDARPLHKKRNDLKLNVIGITDSSHTLHTAAGLGDAALRSALTTKTSTGKLPKRAQALDPATLVAKLPKNTILVDTSASAATVPALLKAKKRGMGAVLANKLPITGDLAWWDAIADSRSRWETTCGAALPVIGTLDTLLNSGDDVKRIEGTLSGTIGFIMSQLEAGQKFGDAVREAKRLGYTEPDPRQDLGGLDVARKALILARMLGYRLAMRDVSVESLYPASMDTLTVDDFLREVDTLNSPMAKHAAQLMAGGRKLRYAAVIESGKLTVGLVGAPSESKLGMAKTSDSVVIFHTKWFNDNPVTISGRGAGQAVTASGVLGDIVSLSRAM